MTDRDAEEHRDQGEEGAAGGADQLNAVAHAVGQFMRDFGANELLLDQMGSRVFVDGTTGQHYVLEQQDDFLTLNLTIDQFSL